jgi:RecG-like helicase
VALSPVGLVIIDEQTTAFGVMQRALLPKKA